MSSTEQNPIHIDVKTQYLDDQSDPDNQRFVFSYFITITNNDEEAVQLLRRHWTITDGDQKTQEVEGEGVIGEQPMINPGDSFSYTSGTIIATEVGSMRGFYTMRTLSGTEFDTPIPTFTLALPNSLH